MTDRKLLYQRELPGGGVVIIDAEPDATSACHARVIVERRTDLSRRDGHVAPVVAEATSADERLALDELYPIAADNVRLARSIVRWQAARREGRA